MLEAILPTYMDKLKQEIGRLGFIATGAVNTGEGEKDAEYFAIYDNWPNLNEAVKRYEKIILCRWIDPARDSDFGAGIEYSLPLFRNASAICWNMTPGGADYMMSHNTGMGALLDTATISIIWPVGEDTLNKTAKYQKVNMPPLHPWETLELAGAVKMEGSELGRFGVYRLPMRIFASEFDGALIRRRD